MMLAIMHAGTVCDTYKQITKEQASAGFVHLVSSLHDCSLHFGPDTDLCYSGTMKTAMLLMCAMAVIVAATSQNVPIKPGVSARKLCS